MAQFKVQARVLDLLGEQQIANSPTAVSELFKNSFDAYARKVSLDAYPVDDRLVLWDDGLGMNEDDLMNRWLVVGTPAKLQDRDNPPPAGFSKRPIQGEKGIGRLAIASLGDSLLLISKKAQDSSASGDPYVALFINWNIVRHRNLMLSDIDVPVISFGALDDLRTGIVDDLVQQFGLSLKKPQMANAWLGENASLLEIIQGQLAQFKFDYASLQRTQLDSSESGTLFFVLNIKQDLNPYLQPYSREVDEPTPNVELVQLLNNFWNRFGDNPLPEDDAAPNTTDFAIDVRIWDHPSSKLRSLFEDWETFAPEDLRFYDHFIDVHFDEAGRYSGTIELFNKPIDLPSVEAQPRRPGTCGPFALRLWYFQGVGSESLLAPEQHQLIDRKLRHFGGLMIYRDNLRVLPYGRLDHDWLLFEDRRSKHAGRAFFSYRRMFGYVAITTSENPRLRDKAGREGLIQNAEYRQMQERLIDFFKAIAINYFFANPHFEEQVEENKRQKGIIDAEQKRAAARRDQLHKELLAALQTLNSSTEAIGKIFRTSLDEVRNIDRPNESEIAAAFLRFNDKLSRIEGTARVNIPKNLAIGRNRDLKKAAHDYKNAFAAFISTLNAARQEFGQNVREAYPGAEQAMARQRVIRDARFQALTKVGRAFADLKTSTEQELARLWQKLDEYRIKQLARVDDCLLVETAADSVEEAIKSETVGPNILMAAMERAAIESVDVLDELGARLIDHLEGFIDGHRDTLLSAQTEEIAQLRETVDRNLELVQLGLAVEIIDHELNSLYRGIKADLSRLQPLVKTSASAVRYVENLRANFQHLEQRYKLMAPLYRGSNRVKSDLDGKRITDYVRTFLNHQLLGVGVKLSATSLFENFRLLEVAAVVFPVFVNLTDNAIFWLRNVDERQIVFDLVGDVVTVCDTGPGIHETMLASIFEPFVTTRPGGRGLGLYVARANLQRHGHEIWATNDPAFKKFSGACFCIRFHPDSVIRG